MKNFLIAALLFFCTLTTYGQDTTYVDIPDPNFEQYLLQYSIDIDDSLNGQAIVVNIQSQGALIMNNRGISDLTGINAFTGLSVLECSNNNLDSLDISSNTALTKFGCEGNNLTSLDVSSNTALTELLCGTNNLDSLDISSNTALTKFSCAENNLTSLDVSNNTALTDLSCFRNEIESLDVSNLISLNQLLCSNNSISSLDFSGLSDLSVISCSSNGLTSLTNLNGLQSLRALWCHSNALTEIDLTGLTSLESLSLNSNSISNLDLSGSRDLIDLSVAYNPITSLDLCGFSSLTELICGNSQLENLILSGCSSLTDILCSDNLLSSLDLSEVTSLTYFDGSNNKLNKLNVNNGTNNLMSTFIIYGNPDLTCIQVDNPEYSQSSEIWNKDKDSQSYFSDDCGLGANSQVCREVTLIPDQNFEQALLDAGIDSDGIINGQVFTDDITNIEVLNLPSLNISDVTGIEDFYSLTNLNCNNNQLAFLNVSGLTNLKELNCSSNNLIFLNTSGCASLEILNVTDNPLETLDVSDLTSLKELRCYSNALHTLNVTGCSSLSTLSCDSNELTKLDLSGLSALTNFDCHTNKLNYLNIKNGANNNIILFRATNNPELTCIKVDAADYSTENWTNIDAQTSFSEACISVLVLNVSSTEVKYDLEIENLLIAADGSSSTHFILEGEDLENLAVKILEDESSQPDLYGSFLDNGISEDKKTVIYTHPEYFDLLNKKSKDVTLQLYNTQTNIKVEDYPIKIVRPSVLMAHGIWSNGKDGFGNMEQRLLSESMYDKEQLFKINYDRNELNFFNARTYKNGIEVLKHWAKLRNTSMGKVDVLAHSNGGLLTRDYIQSKNYEKEKDINKFISYNTPHSGAQMANILRNPTYDFLGNAILNVTTNFLDEANDPTEGIIDDLKVDGYFIKKLNSSHYNKYDDIGVHTITSTETVGNYVENLDFFTEILLKYHLGNLIGGIDVVLESIFHSPNHDIIVSEVSQKGGLFRTTPFPNQIHTGSTANDSIQIKTIDLLNKNPKDGSHFAHNFNPTNLPLPDLPGFSKSNATKQKLSETVSIQNPPEGESYSVGQNVSIEIIGSSGIENIVTAMGTEIIPVQIQATENSNNANVNFTVPNGAIGRLPIVSVGFDANGYADMANTFINVTTTASLDSLSIDQSLIYVSQGFEAAVTVFGHFSDGVDRNITNIETLVYSFNQNNAEESKAGWISGLNIGQDILTVSYLGKSATVPVTIVEAIALEPDNDISQNSINLNGTTDYIAVQHNISLSIEGNFTIEAWIKPNDISGEKTILIKGNNGQCGNYGLFIKDGNLAFLSDGECNWAVSRGPNSALQVGVWQHVAAVSNGNNVDLYINSELTDTLVRNAAAGTVNGAELWIGRSIFSTTNFFFNGLMDEVRIWNAAKSQTDIQSIMNTELSGLESDLLLYYKLDDINEECDVSDCSVNENHGSRINISNNTFPQYINDYPSNLTNVECGVAFSNCNAQLFEVEKIHDSGDPENRINLVILSDGYQENELPKFVTDANNFIDQFFSTTPYKEYANYFNVYIIKVPSNESGASHPGTATDIEEDLQQHPILSVDNYFGSTFDIGGTHRALGQMNGIKIRNVVEENFPLYNEILMLVNTPFQGGLGGGDIASSSTGNDFEVVAIHEIGHSFPELSDEYWRGACGESPNVTQETDPSLVKWKNWLNINGIGIYEIPLVIDGAPEPTNCYKPAETCMMYDFSPFCSVCVEITVEKIHSMVSPIDSYTPSNNILNEPVFPLEFIPSLTKPSPNTLKTSWKLNGNDFISNSDSLLIYQDELLSGVNELVFVVEDTTEFLKIDNHNSIHEYSISWIIENTGPVTDLDDDNDGVSNANDRCPSTPEGRYVDIEGCEVDDDNDGVANNIDNCPNTLPNTIVNSNGCFTLPSNNYNIEVVGETCADKNNGQIIINTNETYNYVATLNGTEYNFNSSLTINNLDSGEYTMCITITDHEYYEQCYGLFVAEATEITGKSTTTKESSKNIETVEINSGTKPYQIKLNGVELFQTNSNRFNLEVFHGDLISISSKFACEGKFEKRIVLDNDFLVYPNPTTGDIEMVLPDIYDEQITIAVYNVQLQLLSNKIYKISDGKIKISLKDKPTGMYFINVALVDSLRTFKIFKQ